MESRGSNAPTEPEKTGRKEWILLAPIRKFLSSHPETTVHELQTHLSGLLKRQISLSTLYGNLDVLQKAEVLKWTRGTAQVSSWEHSQVQPRLRNLNPTELKSWPTPEGARKIESSDGAAYRDAITSQAQVNLLDQVKPGEEPLADGALLGRIQILKPRPARTRLVKKAE